MEFTFLMFDAQTMLELIGLICVGGAVGDLMDKTSGDGFVPEVWSDAIYSFFFRANKLRN